MSLPSKGPNSPFSSGGRTLLARSCVVCERLCDGASFPILNRGTHRESRRRVCHDCHNRRKKKDRERGVGRPSARPPESMQTSAYQHWSAKEDQRLRELIADGTGYEDIAVALGRSLKSVYTRRAILGIPRVRPSAKVQQPWRIEQ